MRDPLAYACVAVLVVVWGSAFALTELALTAFGPLALIGGRLGLAALVVVPAALVSGQGLPRGAEWRTAGTLGVVSLALPFTLLAWAQQTLASSIAAVFIAGAPIFVLLFARLILGAAITPRRAAGFLIGLAGLTWLAAPWEADGPLGALPALGCLVGAASLALGGVLTKALPAMPPLRATAGALLVGTALTLPLGAADLAAGGPGLAIAALAMLGLVQTGLAQFLRYVTIVRAGPVFFTTVSYLVPVFAGVVGIALLNEPLTLAAIGAYGLILGGIWIAGVRPG